MDHIDILSAHITYLSNYLQFIYTYVTVTHPLRTLVGLSFDPPVGAFKFLEELPVC